VRRSDPALKAGQTRPPHNLNLDAVGAP